MNKKKIIIILALVLLGGCGGVKEKEKLELSHEFQEKLNQKVTFDFLETPLEKVVETLSMKTGIKIKLAPKVNRKRGRKGTLIV